MKDFFQKYKLGVVSISSFSGGVLFFFLLPFILDLFSPKVKSGGIIDFEKADGLRVQYDKRYLNPNYPKTKAVVYGYKELKKYIDDLDSYFNNAETTYPDLAKEYTRGVTIYFGRNRGEPIYNKEKDQDGNHLSVVPTKSITSLFVPTFFDTEKGEGDFDSPCKVLNKKKFINVFQKDTDPGLSKDFIFDLGHTYP